MSNTWWCWATATIHISTISVKMTELQSLKQSWLWELFPVVFMISVKWFKKYFDHWFEPTELTPVFRNFIVLFWTKILKNLSALRMCWRLNSWTSTPNFVIICKTEPWRQHRLVLMVLYLGEGGISTFKHIEVLKLNITELLSNICSHHLLVSNLSPTVSRRFKCFVCFVQLFLLVRHFTFCPLQLWF